MALLCTRYVTITDHLLCGCWCYETESYYTTLRHVVNGVINLANPRSLQPPYMYFACERPISMAVERWTNLSMSQQPPWTSDFDHHWSPWWLGSHLITLSTLSSQCSAVWDTHLFLRPRPFPRTTSHSNFTPEISRWDGATERWSIHQAAFISDSL